MRQYIFSQPQMGTGNQVFLYEPSDHIVTRGEIGTKMSLLNFKLLLPS